MVADATTPAPTHARGDGDPAVRAAGPDQAHKPHSIFSPPTYPSRNDRAIFDALDTPGSVIDPFFFAEWSARPEIQRALAARDLLRHNAERLRAEAVRDEALEDARYARAALRHVIDTARAALPSTPPTQDSGPRTQDSGPRTQDPGPRTQDSGPRTQDLPAPTQHALSELRRAATSLGRLAAISRALVDRPAVAVRALAAITTRVHARAAAPSFPTSPLPHSPTQSSVLRPQSSAPPASSLSSPEPVTAAFLAALRRDPDEALPFVAGYRIRAQSQAALRHWLLTARAMLARAGAPGSARIDDKTDTALQHITAPPDDPADPPARLVIKAVLERNARGEHRWCIADVTRAADTS